MIRLATHELVGLLADLSLTAADPATAGATAGVLLHTARGYIGDSPEQTDLFVGTSTDGVILGHTHIGCSGQAEPMLWPIAAVKDVIAVLKPKAKDHDHVVEISQDDEGICLAEDPDLFGEGMRFTFGGLDPSEWPTEGARQMLTEIQVTPPEGSQPVAARTDFLPSRLAPFLKIASRRGDAVQTFRFHQRLPVSVQIGNHYRGVVCPLAYQDDDRAAASAPGGDVYPLTVS